MILGIHIKAARGLLEMNQTELSALTKISIPTLTKIENDKEKIKTVSMRTITTIKEALESKGVKFLLAKDKNSLNGVGVRLVLEREED